MTWISSRRLQNQLGLSWASAEKVIREEVGRSRKQGWHGRCVASLYLVGMGWLLFVPRWAVPEPHHNWRFGVLALPGLFLVVFAQLVLPRLLAADRILSSARAVAESNRALHEGSPSG